MQRIISLVPSQTELLYDLGLSDRVVGITKFCVRPPAWYETKPRIGGTKTVDIQRVMDLKPDLVLANKEENVREQVEAISAFCPVWTSEVPTTQDALTMIRRVGELTDTQKAAEALALQIEAALAKQLPPKGRAAYLIWRKPYMAVGGDTFIRSMMEWAGFDNVFADRMRYPQIGADELAEANPDWILLSSEPFPFSDKHIRELSDICPKARVRLVDGELFSWYGSRMLHARTYFEQLDHA
jgi:ABC-type Fe3+-hydroxamate transport system substrate-binding protein